MLEIERKFLVKAVPDMANYNVTEIEQSYLSFSPEIRIRKKGTKYFITKKSEGTEVREEIEFEIDDMTYEILSNLITGRTIRKLRVEIPLSDSAIAELDVYQDDLEGLFTVEIEFETEEQANEFVLPDWFGLEVTEDLRYKNKNLARSNDIHNLITEKTYKK